MTVGDLSRHWRADLYRFHGRVRFRTVAKLLLLSPTALYMVHWRLARFFYEARPRWLWLAPRVLQTCVINHYSVKFGILLPVHAKVGRGLQFTHSGGIIINSGAVIGNNCVISHGVTLGKLKRGLRIGSPTLGDNVYLAPGAVVLGNVHVGDNAVVAANSVVTKDVAEHAVVGGVPAEVISLAGSTGYATHSDYEW